MRFPGVNADVQELRVEPRDQLVELWLAGAPSLR